MRILILDDSPERMRDFRRRLIGKIVKECSSSKECIKILENDEKFDYIMLDHDLGGQSYCKPGEGTGYEVAEWIANHKDRAPNHILIHSLNNIGATAMMRVLGDVGLRAKWIPFLWLKIGE